MPDGEYTGSLAFIGAGRFQGYYDPVNNIGTGSGYTGAPSGYLSNLFVEGVSPDSGYDATHQMSASSGDYWQITAEGTRNIEQSIYWYPGDWVIFSGSVGETGGTWTRMSADDGIASVIIGDLSASRMFHLGNSNQHILFVTGTAEQTAAMTGSNNLTYDYDTDTLLATGTIDVLGAITASEAQVDNVSIAGSIYHLGDTDTKISFNTDQVSISAGGNPVIYAESRVLADGTGSIVFNNNFYDVDFKVLPEINTVGFNPSFFISGSDGVAHVNYGFESHADVTIDKNKHLYFGNSQESSIEYDQDGTGFLIISGTSGANKGVKLYGEVVDISGDLKISGNDIKDSNDNIVLTLDGNTDATFLGNLTVQEDKKLYFDSNSNCFIEYDADNTNRLIVSGSPTGLNLQGGSLLFDTGMVASGSMNNTASYLALGANGQVVLTTVKAGWGGEGDISSVAAGTGLSGGGDAGAVTLNLDITDIISGDSNNRVLTTDGDGTLTAESGMSYDGSLLSIDASTEITGALRLQAASMSLNTPDSDLAMELSFNGSSSAGSLSWRPADDYFRFSKDVQVPDDKSMRFGTLSEAKIFYNESIDDLLVVSGSSTGMVLSGTTVTIDGDVEISDYIRRRDNSNTYIRLGPTDDDIVLAAGPSGGSPNYFMMYTGVSEQLFFNPNSGSVFSTDVRLNNNKHLYFGSLQDAGIEYDQDGTGFLIISGTAGAGKGVKIHGSVVDLTGDLKISGNDIKDSNDNIVLTLDGTGDASFSGSPTILENKKLYFGSNSDAHIEHDADSSNKLILSGTSDGLHLRGNSLVFDTEMVASGAINSTSSFLALGANGQVILTTALDPAGGDITSVTAGTGLSGGGSTGALTIDLDISDIIASDAENRILTTDGDGSLTAESGMIYDGSKLAVASPVQITGTLNVQTTTISIDSTSDDSQINLDFNGSSSAGTLSWHPANNYFDFSNNLRMQDDKKVYFGTNLDASIEYDEGTSDALVISGSSSGGVVFEGPAVVVSGNIIKDSGNSAAVTFDGSQNTTFGSNAKILDDKKLYFGTNDDATIEYDEDNTDALIISGSSTAGITLSGPSVSVEGPVSVNGNIIKDSGGASAIIFDGSQNTIFGADATVGEDKNLYFGTNQDAYIRFDDAVSDYLIISGSDAGMNIQSSEIILSGSSGVFITGSLGVNTTNITHGITLPNTSVNNNGSVKANAFESYSSVRFKKNIQEINDPLEKVMNMRGVTFEWRDSGKKDIGFIAEEVGQILPEVVSYDSSGQHAESMSYQKLTSLLLECVKEQQKELDRVKSALEILKKKEK